MAENQTIMSRFERDKRDREMRPYFLRSGQEPVPRPDNTFTRVFLQGRTRDVYPIFGGTAGLMTMLTANMLQNYPVGSRPHYMVLAALTGYFVGGVVDYYTTRHWAERDAMMHHYMSLHPEDFNEDPAPKLKYVLYPWYPQRETWDVLKGYFYR